MEFLFTSGAFNVNVFYVLIFMINAETNCFNSETSVICVPCDDTIGKKEELSL